MKNFLVILRYQVTIEVVEEHTAAHRAYLATLYDTNEMMFSGPFSPRVGGVLWLRVVDRARIDAIIDADPFQKLGVAKYEINEFTPTRFSPLVAKAFEG